jgi:hypothetical protein
MYNQAMKSQIPPKHKTSGWKLTEDQKAEIVARAAAGEQLAKLAREFDVNPSSVTLLLQRRSVTQDAIKVDLAERKARIVEKTHRLIETKLNKALKKGKADDITMESLSRLANDLWKQSQVESGKPTKITQNNINELKVSIEKKYLLLQADDSKLLEGLDGE